MNESHKRRGARNGMVVRDATGWLRDHGSGIMTAGMILALLYVGRSVLIPLALAMMLSLLVAPLVRALRRLRLGRTSSVLVAVVALAVSCLGIAAALGTQLLRIAEMPSSIRIECTTQAHDPRGSNRRPATPAHCRNEPPYRDPPSHRGPPHPRP